MMLRNLLPALIAGSLFVVPMTSYADEEEDGDYDIACKSTALFVVGAGVWATTARLGAAIFSGLKAADMTPESSSLMNKCTEMARQYAESQNERRQRYEDFLREYCNNDPNQCPNNLRATQLSAYGDPRMCETYTACALDIMSQTRKRRASVQDIINAMHFVNYSIIDGYWMTREYGYLIGLQVDDGTTSSFQIY